MTPDERRLELAWAAGIIQGEGSIGFYRKNYRRRKDGTTIIYSYPCLSVVQTQPDWGMLERLKLLWPASSLYLQPKKPNRLWVKKFQACSRKALTICEELCKIPEFQGPKRAAAEEVLAFYRLLDAGEHGNNRETR